VPCNASRVVPGAHGVVGHGTHRGSGPKEVHTTPGAPSREAPGIKGGLVDPVTGEALAPLRHEGLLRDPASDLTKKC
jgi:hypothetical protein